MDINVDVLQWLINVLIKRSSSGAIENEIISNRELAKELPKPINKKIEKRKVYSPFTDLADLADMKLISKLNTGFRFL